MAATFADLQFEPWDPKLPEYGVRSRMAFSNGYSASVICNRASYGGEHGLYELAVFGPEGTLDYTTPVTSDVEGHLSEDRVTELLQQIEALPAKAEAA